MAPHDQQTLQSPHEHEHEHEHEQYKIPVVDDDDDDDEIDFDGRSDRVERAQWLRAAILGASDGLLSTSSLMVGIGGVRDDRWSMVLVGLAGAVAGACSMAVGEFVSVSTQRDIHEQINITTTTGTSVTNTHCLHCVSTITAKRKPKPKSHNINCKLDDHVVTSSTASRDPPRNIVETVNTALSPGTGMKVVIMDQDAKEEINSSSNNILRSQEILVVPVPSPSPWKAAAASALAFLCGSFVPMASAMFVSNNTLRTVLIAVVASLALALFGGVGAQLGGVPITPSALRVLLGGWIAMAITYALLKPFDQDDDQ